MTILLSASPGTGPEIFTLGHRNLHGVAFHPETGAPYTVEHGDEVNMLATGRQLRLALRFFR